MKTQKSIFSKLWALTLAGVLVLVLGACSVESASAPTEAPSTTAAVASTEAPTETIVPETLPPETEPVKEFYQVGDTLKARDFEITYLASGSYTYEYPEIFHPAEGNQCIFLKFRATNTTSSYCSYFGCEYFQCYADGNLVDTTDICYLGDNALASSLSAGRTIAGYVYFEVPVDAQNIEVEYDETFISRKYDGSPKPNFIPKFLYEGERDSGLSEAGNPDPTLDAIHMGDTAEFSDFNVSFLSCYQDNSIRIPAKEGYHYVTCEIEYENLSSDSLSINSFCFADGLNCEMVTFQRKGDIIGEVPSGEKATGVWTFAVPDGASVVEFEHIIRLAHAIGDGSYILDSSVIDLVFDASNPTE